MNTEELESAETLIEEFLEKNTLYAEQVWQLKKIKKDLSDFVGSIDIIYGRNWRNHVK